MIARASSLAGSNKIGEAVTECVLSCLSSRSPLAHLKRCLDELRRAGWNEASIRQVYDRAGRVLSAMTAYE
jgi:hypothetical protein